ncbi:MAG: large subunit ribosomal protein [Thermoproteota archaeon]|nr:large subunit ribosomal protein [Thermoproteota archaeon]
MYNTSIKTIRKQITAALSPNLLEEYKTNSMQVREGDTVTIMRGSFAGVEGKVVRVDVQKSFLYVEGITREKTDGTAKLIPIHPSKVMIRNLNLEDKKRKEILQRRSAAKPKKEKEKPKPKAKTRTKMKSNERTIPEEKR